MSSHILLPAVSEIAAIFEQECTALGAMSVDTVQDETRLFGRAVCGPAELICQGDEVHGGVAVRVEGPEVFVHPYSLRKVCVNGAIMPMVHGTGRIERVATEEIVGAAAFTGSFASEMREAIHRCVAREHLSQVVGEMRALTEIEAARIIPILSYAIYSRGLPHQILTVMFDRQSSTDDSSAFGLVNAVTSVARDTQDASMRWQLECVGGELIARAASFADSVRPAHVLAGA